MKKNIGIIYNTEVNYNEQDINGACGGSETWVIQLSKELTHLGYNVLVFRNGDWNMSPKNVEYVPLSLFDNKINSMMFECFIFSANIYDELYDKIIESKCTDNIYVQAHEVMIWHNGLFENMFNYMSDEKRYSNIKKFIALSDFHKNMLNKNCNIPLDKIEIIGNGVDTPYFYKVDTEKGDINENVGHTIMWTSCFGRGADILIDDVLPIVKKQIPDFKVKVCGYVDVVDDKYKNNPDVEILGFKLPKEEYYNELRKCACWFYPCVTAETFNISALDAVVNNCTVISPLLHGLSHTFKPFLPFAMKHKFGTGDTGDKKYDYGTYQTNKNSTEYKKACVEAAEKVIDSMNNYYEYKNIQIRKSLKNYILQEYTWGHIAKKWQNMLNNQ